MTIGFFLADPAAKSSSVVMIIRYNGKRYKHAIGVSVESARWNKKSQRAKVSQDYRQAAIINNAIQLNQSAAERLIYNKNIPEIKDAKHFWALINCEMTGVPYSTVAEGPKSFTEYFDKIYIRKFRTSKTESRLQRFRCALQLIINYETEIGRSLSFDEIGTRFYRELEAYFLRKNYSPNYFGSIIKIIKQVMREAVDVDGIKASNEFRSATFKATSAEVDTVYLTDLELRKIHAIKIDDDFVKKLYPKSEYSGLEARKKSYNIAKNLFLIGAYTGLRLSDFTRLTPGHFADGRITIVTEKTGQRIVIPVHPVVREILASGFNFSEMLSDQKIRLYIKDICRVADITEVVEVRRVSMGAVVVDRVPKYTLVGTHTARRSFATNAYKAGVPTLAIMKITGHTKESTFMRYIRISQ
ncbi:MAG: tyrosine-type recombinase/integrase, partial [Mucinivorans sp.]